MHHQACKSVVIIFQKKLQIVNYHIGRLSTKIFKILTNVWNIKKEEEYHSANIVYASKKSSNDAFRNWINNFNAKFEKNRTCWIGQRAGKNCWGIQLSWKNKHLLVTEKFISMNSCNWCISNSCKNRYNFGSFSVVS